MLLVEAFEKRTFYGSRISVDPVTNSRLLLWSDFVVSTCVVQYKNTKPCDTRKVRYCMCYEQNWKTLIRN